MNKKTILLPALALIFVAACAEKKQLTEMHDNTAEMKDTTVQMEQRMTELQKKTGQMKDITDELYDALRQGNSLQLRREAWRSLLQAPTMFRKISEAGKYFMSFEMQLWNMNGQDMEASKRDVLAQQAAREFFLEVEELAPREGIDVTAEPDGNDVNSVANRVASFNALTIAMQETNRKQNSVLDKDQKLDRISMLSIMEEALLAKNALNAGTLQLGTKEGYVREVLVHEKKALQILQTQFNLFPLVFIDQVSGINDKSWAGKIKMLIGWTFDMDQLNAEQLIYLREEMLQKSLHAKEVMKKIGVVPQLDWKVARLLSKMKVMGQKGVGAKMASDRAQLLDLINQIQKP